MTRPVDGAAVVGAHGFIGSALVARLRSDAVPVTPFTRDVPFMSDAGALVPDAARATTVFWLAASVNPAVAEERPDLVTADLEAFESFVTAAESASEPPTVVLLSSGGTVYDPDVVPPYAEDSPVAPTTAYGRSKLALERTLLASRLPAGRKVVARVANAYGPGQRARRGQGVIAHWLKAAAAGDPLVLIGDPQTVRDYVYIDDIVDLLVRLHAHARPLPEVVNVGAGRPTTLDELTTVVLSAIGDPAIEVERRPARGFDLSATWLDISLAGRELGWSPQTSLEVGVGHAWLEARRHGLGEPGVVQAS